MRHQATGRDAVDVVGEGVVLGHAAQHLDPLAQPQPNVVGDQLGDVLVALADLDGVLVLLVADAPLCVLENQGQEAAHQQHQHQGRQHGGDNHRPLPAAALAAGQQLQDLAGVARPFVGVQLQAAVDQPDQLAVDARQLAVARRPRRGANSLAVQLQPVRQPGGVAQRLVQGRVLARRVARHHHVQERPEAVHVPARVGDLLGQIGLFGGHVKEGAKGRRGVGGQVGLAEIGDQRLAARVQEDVARFQVAVSDALDVDVSQRLADLLEHPQGVIQRQAALFQPLRQRAALAIAHDVVRRKRGEADVDEFDDAGVVVQRGELLDLALEHLPFLAGAVGEELDRDPDAGGFLLGEPDDAVGALAELADGFVAGDREDALAEQL